MSAKVPMSSMAACQVEAIAFLHDIWQRVEDKRPISPDPFYERNDLLTAEVVERVIRQVELMFTSELAKAKAYHDKANEIQPHEKLVPPGFDKMTDGEKRAVVQGLDRIFQGYREETAPPAYYVASIAEYEEMT